MQSVGAPTEIVLQSATGQLEICWPNGRRTSYAYATLRQRCPCAECKSAALRSGAPIGVDNKIKIVNVLPVGQYALQLVFDDGHNRGIYPFAYFRELAAEPA